MPLVWSGAADSAGWICGQVGLLLLLLLLRWAEPRKTRRVTSSFNKDDVLNHLERWICRGELLLSAGHRGEEAGQLATPSSSSRGRHSWRSCDSVLCLSSNRSSVTTLVKPSRWWQGTGSDADEIFFFNKRSVLHQQNNLRLPPPAHGRSGESAASRPASMAPVKNLRRLSGAMVAMVGGVNWMSVSLNLDFMYLHIYFVCI
jgi:hypothetical protein